MLNYFRKWMTIIKHVLLCRDIAKLMNEHLVSPMVGASDMFSYSEQGSLIIVVDINTNLINFQMGSDSYHVTHARINLTFSQFEEAIDSMIQFDKVYHTQLFRSRHANNQA